jgi:ketosteroid isomerase-like protein
MKANEKTEAAVKAALNRFMEAYEKRDIDALMGVLAADDDIFMFGTGPDEKRIGREEFRFQAERDWSQTEAIGFHFSDYHISAAGPTRHLRPAHFALS